MIICGVELKASNALVAVISSDGESFYFVETKCKKLSLEDDESGASIRAFYDDFAQFLDDHEIDVVAIKKRQKKGNFAGGAVSFKIEGLIQHCVPEALLLAPTAVSAAHRKHKYDVPKSLKKYQLQAFLTACTAHTKLQDDTND